MDFVHCFAPFTLVSACGAFNNTITFFTAVTLTRTVVELKGHAHIRKQFHKTKMELFQKPLSRKYWNTNCAGRE